MNKKPEKLFQQKSKPLQFLSLKKRAVKKGRGKSCAHLGSLGTLKIEYRACKLKPWQMGVKQSLPFMRG